MEPNYLPFNLFSYCNLCGESFRVSFFDVCYFSICPECIKSVKDNFDEAILFNDNDCEYFDLSNF